MVAGTKTWTGAMVPDGHSTDAIRVAIVGADAVGLATATILRTTLGDGATVEVFDAGLHRSLVGFQHGRRTDDPRRIAISVEPALMSVLPAPVMTAIVSASPQASPGRRMAVPGLETALLRAAEKRDVRIHDEEPALSEKLARRFDLTVVCREDGRIGIERPDENPSLATSGSGVEETFLTMSCRIGVPVDEVVATNGFQRRARAFPGTGGDVLSIRLSTSEASLLRWIVMRRREAGDPVPSSFVRDRSETLTFRSTSGNHVLVLDHPDLGTIGRRIASVLSLYGVGTDTVDVVSLDRVASTRRSRFTAPSRPGTARSGSTTFLGRAAFARHPWSEGDLSLGLWQAISLAECLSRDWRGASGSVRDLARHEGEMHRLQFLEELRNREEATDPATGVPLARILDDAVFAMEDPSTTLAGLERIVRDRVGSPSCDALVVRLRGLDDQSLRMIASAIAAPVPEPAVGTIGISVLRGPMPSSAGGRPSGFMPLGILSRLKGDASRRGERI